MEDLSHQLRDCSIQTHFTSPTGLWRSSSPSSEPPSPATATSVSSISTSTPLTPPMSPVFNSRRPSLSRHDSYQSSNIRAQRQRAVRSLCSSSHQAEIAALVSRMVTSGEQCSVGSPSSRPPSPDPALPSHRTLRLARQDTDFSDGSVSPFSRISYDYDDDEEDEDMSDQDQVGTSSDLDDASVDAISEQSHSIDQSFTGWQFSWGGAPSRAAAESASDRKCYVMKDTRSRKYSKRR